MSFERADDPHMGCTAAASVLSAVPVDSCGWDAEDGGGVSGLSVAGTGFMYGRAMVGAEAPWEMMVVVSCGGDEA